MSAPTKNLGNLAVIHMVTSVNRERIDTSPPNLDYDTDDPDQMKYLIDNAQKGAYKYDNYKDIIQVSFSFSNLFMHYVWCDEEPRIIQEDNTVIKVASTEYDLMKDVTDCIQNLHQEIDHTVVQAAVFAGWQLKERIWPILVNKAFSYKLPIPSSLLSDPMRKFQTTDYLLEAGVIYSQGAWSGARPLPALADALTFWGYGERAKYPVVSVSSVCTDPVASAKDAEVYLKDLRHAIADYYERN